MTGDEPDLDSLLDALGRQRYLFYQFDMGRGGPDILGAVHDWGEVADVLVVVDPHHACAFRTPVARHLDVFDPESVYWWFTSSPVWTGQTLLRLPQPADPNAPREVVHPPKIYRLPAERRKTVRVNMRIYRDDQQE